MKTLYSTLFVSLSMARAFQFQPIRDDQNILKNFKPTSKLSDPASKSNDPSSIVTTEKPATTTSVVRRAQTHKRWGVDNEHEDEYFFDSRIHTLGNVGLGGAVHAALAPLSTKIIDLAAYDGVDIRAMVAEDLRARVKKANARVLDMCCGVGISTRSLQKAFPTAETVIGIDTSPEMVSMACFLSRHVGFFEPILQAITKQLSTLATTMKEQGKKMQVASQNTPGTPCNHAVFIERNAESTELENKSFDLITIMYAFHEAPKAGRERILNEARRLLAPGGTLAIVDIADDYAPSPSMLAGEPYVLEYQRNIHTQIKTLKGFLRPTYKVLIPGHVGIWLLKRSYARA